MNHSERYDSLTTWQKAMVNAEALRVCRDDPEYQRYEALANGDWHDDICLTADSVCYTMRQDALDGVLEDTDFMEAITTEAEDRYMTRGNANAR